MNSYNSGDRVKYGAYVSKSPLDIRMVESDGDVLDGRSGASYKRISTPLAVAASPLLGGAFVMLFPLAVVSFACFYAAKSIATSVFGNTAQLAVVRWDPTTAYIRHPKGNSGDKENLPTQADRQMDDLRQQVKTARENEDAK